MGRAYRIIDTAVLIVCLPFYAVFVPIMLLTRWLRQRRRLDLGLVVSHWPARDIREDYQVVDLSRLDEGVVGIRYRTWCRDTVGTPPWSTSVRFVDRSAFWDPPLRRSRASNLPNTPLQPTSGGSASRDGGTI